MQAVTITQITPPELSELIRKTVNEVLGNLSTIPKKDVSDNILDIDEAAELLGIARQTLYFNDAPRHKRGRRLYFFESELRQWLKEGKKKTSSDYAAEANQFLTKK